MCQSSRVEMLHTQSPQDVAGQTLEGLRNETRAGFEYALQTHKTIDVQMDLNAPVIIVPEE